MLTGTANRQASNTDASIPNRNHSACVELLCALIDYLAQPAIDRIGTQVGESEDDDTGQLIATGCYQIAKSEIGS